MNRATGRKTVPLEQGDYRGFWSPTLEKGAIGSQRICCALSAGRIHVGPLPNPHFAPGLVEDPCVVPFAHFLTGLLVQQTPQRGIRVIDLQVLFLARGSNLVCPEEETVGVAID